jgi:hypothetical protein
LSLADDISVFLFSFIISSLRYRSILQMEQYFACIFECLTIFILKVSPIHRKVMDFPLLLLFDQLNKFNIVVFKSRSVLLNLVESV